MEVATSEQVGQLLAASEPRMRAYVGLCAFAGLRLGEASAMNVSDVDFLRRRLDVERQVQKRRGGPPEIRRAEVRVEPHGVRARRAAAAARAARRAAPALRTTVAVHRVGPASPISPTHGQQLVAADRKAAGVEGSRSTRCGTTSRPA